MVTHSLDESRCCTFTAASALEPLCKLSTHTSSTTCGERNVKANQDSPTVGGKQDWKTVSSSSSNAFAITQPPYSQPLSIRSQFVLAVP